MGNGIPYGNAFLVRTPALDQLEQRLFLEQKQREAQSQTNAKLLDDEFSKNVSNIRDADVDEFTKAYQDYKTSAQATMRQKDGVPPQQQMELLRKKAAMYKLINESKAEREREELLSKRYAVKPDDFNDNAAELLIKGRQLPIGQKRSYKTAGADGKETIVDLTNPENLLWQDKTNWQPILQKAGGTLTQRGKPTVVDLPGGLEEEITTYKGGNDPVEYYQSIVGAMTRPRDQQSLASRYNFTPEEAQDIMAKFEELKKTPAFKAAYGDVKFPESAGISQGGKTAMLLAMTNAINNPPTETRTKSTKKDVLIQRQEAFREKMFNLAEAGRNKRAAMNQAIAGLGDYDVFGRYERKYRPMTVTLPKTGWGKPETKDVVVVLDKDVDVNDKKLIGDVKPAINDKGEKYYIVRDDGDWEGRDGQVISRDNAARKNMDATTMSEVKRGRLSNEIAPSGTRVPKDITQTRMQPKTYKVGGQTISKEKIEAGAKKYNMSVDEYLKRIGAQ